VSGKNFIKRKGEKFSFYVQGKLFGKGFDKILSTYRKFVGRISKSTNKLR
jgi:hypothetical protein